MEEQIFETSLKLLETRDQLENQVNKSIIDLIVTTKLSVEKLTTILNVDKDTNNFISYYPKNAKRIKAIN